MCRLCEQRWCAFLLVVHLTVSPFPPLFLSSLSLLDVSRNGICRDGAFALADMLRSPRCHLTDLLVAYNPLSPEGCVAIATALKALSGAHSSTPGVSKLQLRWGAADFAAVAPVPRRRR